jgi:hypothetical protein
MMQQICNVRERHEDGGQMIETGMILKTSSLIRVSLELPDENEKGPKSPQTTVTILLCVALIQIIPNKKWSKLIGPRFP